MLFLLLMTVLLETHLVFFPLFDVSLDLLQDRVLLPSFSLDRLVGNQPLDLGRLGLLLLTLNDSAHHILPHIILLIQVEQLADVCLTLGPQSPRLHLIGEPRDVIVTLLHQVQVHHREVRAHDASSHALTLAFTGAFGAVAGLALLQQETHPGVAQDTLLHGETLFVISSCDLKDVALELVAKGVTLDLSRHTFVKEREDLVVVVYLDLLHAPREGVGNVQLHGVCVCDWF